MRLAAAALFLSLSGAICASPLAALVTVGTGLSSCPDTAPHTSRFVTGYAVVNAISKWRPMSWPALSAIGVFGLKLC
ncbi:MAG: hypothetical protein WA742_02015 [Candidatus Cybelea sp.]